MRQLTLLAYKSSIDIFMAISGLVFCSVKNWSFLFCPEDAYMRRAFDFSYSKLPELSSNSRGG